MHRRKHSRDADTSVDDARFPADKLRKTTAGHQLADSALADSADFPEQFFFCVRFRKILIFLFPWRKKQEFFFIYFFFSSVGRQRSSRQRGFSGTFFFGVHFRKILIPCTDLKFFFTSQHRNVFFLHVVLS